MDDIGHRETEKLIAQMEREVSKIYLQAEKELQKKLHAYLASFKAKDAKKREAWQAGEIKKEDYDKWRTGQMMIGKRWKEMRDTLAQDLHNSNEIARSVVNGYMPEVYAINHNYGTFQVEKESKVDTSYTLYDRQTVERIIRDNPDLLPGPGEQMKKTFQRFDDYKSKKKVELSRKEKKAFDKLMSENKDIRWQKGKLQSVMTQSILQGESVPHMAQRVARTMGEINRKATTRYVRTAATGAQNAGRIEAYQRAQNMGIELEQEWLATLDNRTRHEHRELDGQHVPVGTPFKVDGEEIMFPGDPAAPGYLIWNCRCTLVPRLKSLDQSDAPRDDRLEGITYEKWKEGHTKTEEKTEDLKQTVAKTNAYYEEQTVSSLADAYEHHRKNNNLRSVEYEKIKDKGVVVSNYGKIDERSAEAFSRNIQELASEYDTSLQKVRLMDKQEFVGKNNAFAFVRHDYDFDSSIMVINPAKVADYDNMTSRVRDLAQKGYSVSIAANRPGDYIVTHEFAHTLIDTGSVLDKKRNFLGADYDKIRSARKEIETAYTNYINSIKPLNDAFKKAELEVIMGTPGASAEKTLELKKALNSEKLSNYSMESADEFMAEAFAYSKLGGKGNKHVEKVMEILDRNFKRKR